MAKIAPSNKNILVVAGDPSGDLHAANLIKALRAKDPEITVTAMGGVRMQEVCNRFLYNLVSVGAVGFAEPFKHFFLWFKLIKLVRRYMEEKRPSCVIAVDFYGFNHQVLGLAAHRKIPAFYYISPQVWASRPGRAAKLAKLTKELFVIFPFEADLYKKVKGNATFVGHPLLDLMPEPAAKDFPPANGEWRIGILPGSRKTEISRHLPLFIKAFYRIKEQHPKARAYLFAVPEFPDELLVTQLEAVEKYWSKDIEIVREKDYKERANLDFAFTCSGTATLENGLLGVPMAVAYKMQRLTYAVAKRIAKVQYISLVNILLKKPAVKELIQEAATVDGLAQEAFSYINNPPRMQAARKELIGLRTMLGSRGAAERAAARIVSYLS
ncbi:MAG: lipid-A-disaccharide synthase [Elusimicrobia bacterium GWB2_63_22]|nr:MAG: lipid-A-disaccharide synthase [Elusimicrobia bacterium GWB2_63_22]